MGQHGGKRNPEYWTEPPKALYVGSNRVDSSEVKLEPVDEAAEVWMDEHHTPDWEARLVRMQQGW